MSEQKSPAELIAEYLEYLGPLFDRALKRNPFHMLCTLLRVDGIRDKSWDPFLESREAAIDFAWMHKKSLEEKKSKAAIRLMLLIYSQLTEMSDVHQMLFNVLRCCGGQPYQVRSLQRLGRKKKGFDYIPPSAAVKFNEIKKLARSTGEERLAEIIEGFWNAEIRNSFSHSDYILTDSEYRITEGGHPRSVALLDVSDKFNRCVNFYAAFFKCHSDFKKALARGGKYHKGSQYEVLELLCDEKEGANGFRMHFSNGESALFQRTDAGTTAVNLQFEREGLVNFFVGSLDALQPTWKIDGRPATDEDFK